MAEHGDTWYEGVPNFGWADARRHSPQLLAVPPRPRRGSAAADGAEGGADSSVMRPAFRKRPT